MKRVFSTPLLQTKMLQPGQQPDQQLGQDVGQPGVRPTLVTKATFDFNNALLNALVAQKDVFTEIRYGIALGILEARAKKGKTCSTNDNGKDVGRKRMRLFTTDGESDP